MRHRLRFAGREQLFAQLTGQPELHGADVVVPVPLFRSNTRLKDLAIDIAAMKVKAVVPVGEVPKRNSRPFASIRGCFQVFSVATRGFAWIWGRDSTLPSVPTTT